MHLEDSLVEVIALCSSSKMFNTLCLSPHSANCYGNLATCSESGGGTSDGLSFDRGGWGLGRIVTFLNASHDGTGMNSCSCKGQSYTQWTFLAVIYICKWWWLLLLICYRETNAKVAADSEREELEIKLKNAELLAKKRDDEVNSYRKEVRISTPFDWVFFNQNQNNRRNHWIDHKNNFFGLLVQ